MNDKNHRVVTSDDLRKSKLRAYELRLRKAERKAERETELRLRKAELLIAEIEAETESRYDRHNKRRRSLMDIIVGILFISPTFSFWAIFALVSFIVTMRMMPPGGYNQPKFSSTSSASSSTSPTEAELKAVYRANGTTYDDRMLREDARQVEILAREQGMTIDQSVIIWSTQR